MERVAANGNLHVAFLGPQPFRSMRKCFRIKIRNGACIALLTVGCQYLLPLYNTNMQKDSPKQHDALSALELQLESQLKKWRKKKGG